MEENWPEDSLSEVAQADVLTLMAWQRNAKGKKGQGKQRRGKGLNAGGKDWSGKRNLSLEERKRKLAELKPRTRCQACGQQGHWAGDRQCPRSKGSGGGKGSTQMAATAVTYQIPVRMLTEGHADDPRALAATTKEWSMSDDELLGQLMPAIAMDDDDAEDLAEI